MTIKALIESPTAAYIVLSLVLFASGYSNASMRSWFLAVVNWLGALFVLLACAIILQTENGNWFEFGIVIVVAITEASLLFRYVYRMI